MMESAADRAAMLADGDVARVGGYCVAGWYNAPYTDDAGVQAYSPTFLAQTDALADAGIGAGTVIDAIELRSTGRGTLPAHVARVLQPQDDGAMMLVQLEVVTP